MALSQTLKSCKEKRDKKIRNVDKAFTKQLDLEGVKSAVYKKDYPKIEKQNNISINAFRYEDETPEFTLQNAFLAPSYWNVM